MEAVLRYFAPADCYEEIFVNFNFTQVRCFSAILSRVLSFLIITGAVLVKMPQIVKIVRAGSVQGISMLATFLELTAVTFTGAYNFAKGFPFSTYGENMFLDIQIFIIFLLIFYYNDQAILGGIAAVLYLGVLYSFLSGLVPLEFLTYLQSTAIPIIIISRMSQIVSTFRLGSTGQLSFITSLLLWGGALARIFTTLQETNDPLMLAQFSSTAVLNTIILIQFFIYWSATQEREKQQ